MPRGSGPVETMASAIIAIAKSVVFLAVSVSAIVSLYAAMDAMAVYTDVNLFACGFLLIVIGVVLGPLFCFFAAYGLVLDLDVPLWQAVAIVAPVFLAWGVIAGRFLVGLVAR